MAFLRNNNSNHNNNNQSVTPSHLKMSLILLLFYLFYRSVCLLLPETVMNFVFFFCLPYHVHTQFLILFTHTFLHCFWQHFYCYGSTESKSKWFFVVLISKEKYSFSEIFWQFLCSFKAIRENFFLICEDCVTKTFIIQQWRKKKIGNNLSLLRW